MLAVPTRGDSIGLGVCCCASRGVCCEDMMRDMGIDVGVWNLGAACVICSWGVMGDSTLGFEMCDAVSPRTWPLSRRRLGASLTLGCV
jgi:hypothetical protein